MIKKTRFFGAALFAIVSIASGCAGAKTPAEKAAAAFMDAYYVQADLAKAAEVTDSLAQDKVKSGLELRDGLTIDAQAHHPKIVYKLKKADAASDQAEFIYDVEFHPEKAEAFHKTTRLMVRRRDGGQWKVTQFSDHDSL